MTLFYIAIGTSILASLIRKFKYNVAIEVARKKKGNESVLYVIKVIKENNSIQMFSLIVWFSVLILTWPTILVSRVCYSVAILIVLKNMLDSFNALTKFNKISEQTLSDVNDFCEEQHGK
jgi:hypothetical protein